ncbi:undecaprenyl/decaprenyl-phosphate alpha-N-acetylglucosaminyl 1-phosphate transferase [Thiorhodococcus mannitoliphagus]|uniref:Undecaprenyl/decaprenyl-phosphate alpha-N-acetylglucosaminyl 1-phosphate transferase n=1 Tax=Thiorhodococcus mannitoliphagus TaxID=329406 RepID=A0A6P1DW90_9GAMM|nr:MraY family glycosyltransferase [Thiorhodococcus mannitoliphagus]NEX21959.1 undecaprenyl/decaprenyl-phosphate alpha-N-acetylglucosaminyl 1-phosphate transferase [Thiorhodococcus mannitoliphagus]
MQAVYILLLALSISMVLIPPLKRLGAPLGLTDIPNARKIHDRAIPRSGGIAIASGTLISAWLLISLDQQGMALIAAWCVLLVFGLLDDRLNLDYRLKLLGQIIAGSIAVVAGDIMITEVPFLGVETLPTEIAIPLTVFLLTAITNAVNLSDGLDGLAGGLSILALGCLAIFAYQSGDQANFALTMALMGATFGFLRFNSSPAQIFMGDSGSQFLGFGVGVLAISITQRPDTALGPLTPLLVLALPILDTLNVMTRRIAAGRSPFSADKLHLHHQLLEAGLSQNQAVSLVYMAQVVAVALAYALRYSSDIAIIGSYVALSVAILAGIHALNQSHHHAQLPRKHAPLLNRVLGVLDSLEAKSASILVFTHRALCILLVTVLVGGAAIADAISADITTLAITLLALAVIAPWLPLKPGAALDRVCLYAAGLVILFLATPPLRELLGTLTVVGLFGAMALLTGIWVRAEESAFCTSSLDILILIIAGAIPLFSAPLPPQLAFLVPQAIILFYSIEVILSRAQRRWSPLRLALLVSLTILTLKGLTL